MLALDSPSILYNGSLQKTHKFSTLPQSSSSTDRMNSNNGDLYNPPQSQQPLFSSIAVFTNSNQDSTLQLPSLPQIHDQRHLLSLPSLASSTGPNLDQYEAPRPHLPEGPHYLELILQQRERISTLPIPPSNSGRLASQESIGSTNSAGNLLPPLSSLLHALHTGNNAIPESRSSSSASASPFNGDRTSSYPELLIPSASYSAYPFAQNGSSSPFALPSVETVYHYPVSSALKSYSTSAVSQENTSQAQGVPNPHLNLPKPSAPGVPRAPPVSPTQNAAQQPQAPVAANIPPTLPKKENGGRHKYVCKTCEKSFTTSGHLARHVRIHTGERKHVCPYPGCGSRFARQDNCLQHFRTHKNKGKKRAKKIQDTAAPTGPHNGSPGDGPAPAAAA